MRSISHLIAHLPYLAEVSNTLSFTKAAESMHLSQAAISYQIKQLEEKTGTQMVLRQSGSPLKLTCAGEALAKEYQYCAKRLSLALHQLDHEQLRGELRLSAPVDFGSVVMPKIMAHIRQLAPELKIDLHTSDAVMDLSTSPWEMAIRVNTQTDVINPDPLFYSDTYLVASPAYLESYGKPSSLLSLKKHRILIRESSKFRAWSKLLKNSKVSFRDLQQRITLGNSFAICEAAKEGLGLAMLPEFIVKDALNSQCLIPLMPNKTKHARGTFYLARIDAPQLTRYEALIRQAFKDVYTDNAK